MSKAWSKAPRSRSVNSRCRSNKPGASFATSLDLVMGTKYGHTIRVTLHAIRRGSGEPLTPPSPPSNRSAMVFRMHPAASQKRRRGGDGCGRARVPGGRAVGGRPAVAPNGCGADDRARNSGTWRPGGKHETAVAPVEGRDLARLVRRPAKTP